MPARKFWLLSFLFPALVTTAFARPTLEDDDLMHALRNLEGRVEIDRRAFMGRARRNGFKVMIAGALIATYASAEPWSWQPRPNLLKAGHLLFASGAIVWAAGVVTPLFYQLTPHEDVGKFRSKDELQIFFTLPLDEQYVKASQDSELANFILNLSQAYEYIERGLPMNECMANEHCAR